jgi:hypothetical protein
MNDNQLIKEIISVINANLPLWDLPNVIIKQSFQPTNQGAESLNTAYLHKLFDKRYGFTKKSDKWDEAGQKMIHTETQFYETTFQITALAIQNPRDTNSLTSSDIANVICSMLQSDFALKSFSDKGIGILRVMDVRNPSFVDDKERNEYSPSFDFVLTHERIKTWETPAINTTEFNINRV